MKKTLLFLILISFSYSQSTLWKIVGSKVYLANKFWTLSMREGMGTGLQLGYVTSGDSGSVRYYNGILQYYDGGAWRTVGYSGDPNSFSKPQIDTVGTVVSGTWNASTITTIYGGTGLTSYTQGDIPYYNSGTAFSKLALGSSNQILGVSNAAPTIEYKTLATTAIGTDFTIDYSGSTINFNIPTVSASARGLLTSALFTTFSNKKDQTDSVNYISGYVTWWQKRLDSLTHVASMLDSTKLNPNIAYKTQSNTFSSGTTQTMPELAVTDTAHIKFLIQDSVRNKSYLCKKSERNSIVAGTWDTVAVLSNSISGTVTRLFLALNHTISFSNKDSIKVRITCDDAATPQIGGTSGIPILALFGRVYDTNYVFYSDRITLSTNTGKWNGSEWNEIYIPFSAGILVEIYTPSDGGTTTTYSMIEYTSQKDFIVNNVNLKNWRLKINYVSDTTISGLDTATFLNCNTETMLFAVFHNTKYSSFNNWAKSNEGNYLIYYDGETTPSFESSGGEDLFGSSFTFNNQDTTNIHTYYTKNAGLLYLDEITHLRQSTYRFFDYLYMPRATSSMIVKWINGDNDSGTPGNTTSESLVFYYVKN